MDVKFCRKTLRTSWTPELCWRWLYLLAGLPLPRTSRVTSQTKKQPIGPPGLLGVGFEANHLTP